MKSKERSEEVRYKYLEKRLIRVITETIKLFEFSLLEKNGNVSGLSTVTQVLSP